MFNTCNPGGCLHQCGGTNSGGGCKSTPSQCGCATRCGGCGCNATIVGCENKCGGCATPVPTERCSCARPIECPKKCVCQQPLVPANECPNRCARPTPINPCSNRCRCGCGCDD